VQGHGDTVDVLLDGGGLGAHVHVSPAGSGDLAVERQLEVVRVEDPVRAPAVRADDAPVQAQQQIAAEGLGPHVIELPRDRILPELLARPDAPQPPLQGNAKTIEGTQHPDRDAQFRYVNEQAKQ
jgi:hypothetical protein